MDSVEITLDEAISLFYEIADNQDIPFHASQACQARCSDMTNILNERGIPAKFVCAYARANKALWVDWHHGMKAIGGWVYHIAPIVQVTDENGQTRDLVFDPSLFDGPVSVRDWGNQMQADKNGLVICVSDEVANPTINGFYNYSIGNVKPREIRKQYKLWADRRGPLRRMVQLSPICNRYFAQKRDVNRPKFGKTWTTDKKFRETGEVIKRPKFRWNPFKKY